MAMKLSSVDLTAVFVSQRESRNDGLLCFVAAVAPMTDRDAIRYH